MPVGPLGLHIKLKPQYEKWGRAVENALGKWRHRQFLHPLIAHRHHLWLNRVCDCVSPGPVLSAYVVRTQKDRALLQQLMREVRCNRVIYTCQSKGRHPAHLSPPGAKVLAVANCVQVRHPKTTCQSRLQTLRPEAPVLH